MEKSLIAFGIHWILLHRQQLLELLRDQNGIFHFTLGGTRMHTPAIDMEFCSGCIKVFIFQFPQRSAVHGVGIIRTEQLHIKMIGSSTHFLIRGKADPDLTMLFLRMH